MNIFTQFFKKNADNESKMYDDISRDLLRREAEIGGKLFGPTPKGSSRKFFHLENNIWVWVEEWTVKGRKHSKTTKYLLKPNDLLKSVNGSHYERTSLQEAIHFEQAVKLYVEEVDSKLYGNVIKSSI
jgi:hypothetical protein